jgi:hypothetical protein
VHRAGHAPWSRKVAGDTSVSLTAKLSTRKHDAAAAPARDSDTVYDPFAH